MNESDILFNCPNLHEARIELVPFSQQQFAVRYNYGYQVFILNMFRLGKYLTRRKKQIIAMPVM
jgi:hypothetical protein